MQKKYDWLFQFFFLRNAPKLSFVEWNKYLDEISKNKKVEVNIIKDKLVHCGKPGFTGATVRKARPFEKKFYAV